MKFYNGEVVTFNMNRYRVQGERLGRGAVSDVYLALLDGLEDARVVLKVVRDNAADDLGKAEALQREAEVLTQLNQAEDDVWRSLPDALARYRRTQETASHRRIIALLDSGDIAPGQPLVVQEVAPPALERFDVATPLDEHRVLLIVQAVVDVISLTHRAGMSLKDFEPATKGDRFRVQWLDEAHSDFTFKMIDWNITGGPEAMAQDLFFFGGHLYYLLTGRHIPLDAEGRPPANLGMGNPAWNTLTAGSQQLVAKLLHRDIKRRYQQIEVLAADVAWWNDVLAQIEASGVFRRLDDRLWQAKPVGRYDRVLAVADLALCLDPPADTRQSFEQSRKQAHEELDKENWLPIAQALVTLGTRAYEKADQEFATQLKILPPESEAARLATIYQRLARVGQLFKVLHQGADERRTPEWEALETRAVKALVERRWQDAQGALAEVVQLRPESRTWEPLKDLGNWIMGGARYTRKVAVALTEAENHTDEMTPAWLTAESEKTKLHEKALVLLEQVQEMAPFEPEFKERLSLERTRLKQRQMFFGYYVPADEAINQGKVVLQQARESDEKQTDYRQAAETYQNALQMLAAASERFEAILSEDPTQRRAQLFARRMQIEIEKTMALYQQANALDLAQQALQSARYEEALDQVQAVLRLAPGRKDALALAAEVCQQQQATSLHQAQQEMAAGRYAEAKPYVQQVLHLAPDRQDAQEMDVEVDVGARLVQQVHIYLQGAETDRNNGDFDQALEQLRRFDGWDGRALRDLLAGQALPGMVGVRPFRLLPDLRTEAGALRQRIENERESRHRQQEVISNTLKTARDAEEKWNFTEVIRVCVALESSCSLPPELVKIRDRALRYIENRQLAETLIANAQGFPDLGEALGVLGDDAGSVSLDLRRQAAEKWLLLAQALAATDLVSMKDQLGNGLPLSKQTETLFANSLTLADKAILVNKALPNTSSTRPKWFAPDGRRSLVYLSEALEALADQQQSWTDLRQRATEWRTGLLKHLDGFVLEELGRIQTQSQSRQFAAALAALVELWEGGIPTALRGDLPASTQDSARNLREALRGRLAAGKEFDVLLSRLKTSPDYAFQVAGQEAAVISLPAHPAVPIDDLIAVRAELERAAKMELTAALQPVADLEPEAGRQNYAQVLHTCRVLVETRLDTLVTDVSRRTSDLQEGLKGTGRATVRNLQNTLKEAVEEQKQHPTAAPRRMLDLYYQAWWVQSLSLALPSIEMQLCLELPKMMLAAAAEQLITLHDPTGFRVPELLLGCAETLNNELGYLPLDKLPPLSEKVHPADIGIKWRIETGALDAFKTQVGAFKELLQSASQVKIQTSQAAPALDVEDATDATPLAPTYRYDAGQVSALQALARDIQQAFKRLRELWQALELSWDDDAELAQIGKEAGIHCIVATQLGEAQHLQSNQAMQGLALLYRELEEKGALKGLEESPLSLLATLRQALKVNFEALQQGLIAALGRQIAGILDLPDAAIQLQQQILTVPQSRWLAEKAYQAIRQGVDEQASRAEAEGRRDTASRLWGIVQAATEPWTSGEQVAFKKVRSSRNKTKPAPVKAVSPVAAPIARPSAPTANKSGATRPPMRTTPTKR